MPAVKVLGRRPRKQTRCINPHGHQTIPCAESGVRSVDARTQPRVLGVPNTRLRRASDFVQRSGKIGPTGAGECVTQHKRAQAPRTSNRPFTQGGCVTEHRRGETVIQENHGWSATQGSNLLLQANKSNKVASEQRKKSLQKMAQHIAKHVFATHTGTTQEPHTNQQSQSLSL